MRLCLTTIVAVLIATAAFAQPTDTEIYGLVQKIAAANHGRDPYKIQIGDSIRVPTDVGDTVYVAEPWMVSRKVGEKGCFWKIAELHLKGAAIVPLTPAPTPALPAGATASTQQGPWLYSLGFAVAGLLAVGLIAEVSRRRQLDPRRGPPVVPGGISRDPAIALRQFQGLAAIRAEDSGRVVREVTRGQIISPRGDSSFIARVEHGDGRTRDKRIAAGTDAWRVMVGNHTHPDEAARAEYYLEHCGNRVAERRDQQFELPAGWMFRPVAGATARQQEQATTTAAGTPFGLSIKRLAGHEQGVAVDGVTSHDVSEVKMYSDGGVTVRFRE